MLTSRFLCKLLGISLGRLLLQAHVRELLFLLLLHFRMVELPPTGWWRGSYQNPVIAQRLGVPFCHPALAICPGEPFQAPSHQLG